MRPLLVFAGLLVLASGCLGLPTEEAAEEGSPEPADDGFEPATYTFEDEFLAAGADEPHEYSFHVPEGATEVAGLLTWEEPAAALEFELVDPGGDVVAEGWAESETHRYVTTTEPPQPGNWTVVVRAKQGADVQYQLDLAAREGEDYGPISRTYTVQPQDFVEINLNMEPEDWFTFAWEASGELSFNVHYHEDGETHRPIEHTGTQLEGNFTAPVTQVYSPVWVNEGALPVEVQVSLDGDYRLHSMTREDPPESVLSASWTPR